MTDLSIRSLILAGAVVVFTASLPALAQQQHAAPVVTNAPSQLQPGDYIAAVVNQDIVAASEVIQHTEKLRQDAKQRGEALPDTAAMHKQALDSLIDERVLVTYARENGNKI